MPSTLVNPVKHWRKKLSKRSPLICIARTNISCWLSYPHGIPLIKTIHINHSNNLQQGAKQVRLTCLPLYRFRVAHMIQKILYFVWSPPCHLYMLLLANLLAFYLTYLLAFYLAYLLAFYLAYLLAYYLLKSSGILSGKHSGTLSGISSGILSDIISGILSGISSNILSGISPGTLSGISYGILSGIFSRILSDILSGISYFWHSIRLLRSSGAHWARKAPGWGPAVRTELGRSQVEVHRCALS